MRVDFGLTTSAVLQGMAIGLLVSVLFSLVPLLEVRHVKPSLLLRQDVPPSVAFRLAEMGRYGRRCSRAGWGGVVAGRLG